MAPSAPASTGNPIVDRADGTDPEHEALLADSVGLALLVVLETLTPPERIAFVLHDMFAMPFDEIAPIVAVGAEGVARRRGRGRPPNKVTLGYFSSVRLQVGFVFLQGFL